MQYIKMNESYNQERENYITLNENYIRMGATNSNL